MVIWIAEEPLSLSGKKDIDKDAFKVAEVGDVEADNRNDIGIVVIVEYFIVGEVNEVFRLLVILVISKDDNGVDGTIWIVIDACSDDG